MQSITVGTIRAKVKSDRKWAERAIVVLFDYQTADEQSTEITRHVNGVGFNGADAPLLSSFAKQLKGLPTDYHPVGGTPRHLSPKQLSCAFNKLPKYAAQLLKIAQDKTAVAPVTVSSSYAPASIGVLPGDTFVEEASTLGLRSWPDSLEYNSVVFAMQAFRRDGEGEIIAAVYKAVESGVTLTVLND